MVYSSVDFRFGNIRNGIGFGLLEVEVIIIGVISDLCLSDLRTLNLWGLWSELDFRNYSIFSIVSIVVSIITNFPVCSSRGCEYHRERFTFDNAISSFKGRGRVHGVTAYVAKKHRK